MLKMALISRDVLGAHFCLFETDHLILPSDHDTAVMQDMNRLVIDKMCGRDLLN